MEMNDIVNVKNEQMILSMSGIYERMYPGEGCIDMNDIPGTNCYCDEAAADAIRKRIGDKAGRIRLMDSGNYHYLSFFFMEMIREPFALFMIDNHTDLQVPGFGRILSCGGWVRYAIEELDMLKHVYLLGMSEEHLVEAGELPEVVTYINRERSWNIPSDLPVYLSIDKDVLSGEFCATDWDQGDMTVDELTGIVSRLSEKMRILGVDICGEKKEDPTEEEINKNLAVNAKLLELVSRYLI